MIRFELGEIVTNPDPGGLSGPEIADLQLHEGPFRDAALEVWRPGEGVFAGRDLVLTRTLAHRHERIAAHEYLAPAGRLVEGANSYKRLLTNTPHVGRA